jgi:hypothetical protein
MLSTHFTKYFCCISTTVAEAKRFELLDPFEPSVFKTDAIDHSAKLPSNLCVLYILDYI